MAGFLFLSTYVGTVLGFCFMTLSLATGLYYLAELVEEYTVMTKRIIKWTTGAVILAHVALLVMDRLPFMQIAFSIGCHLWYSLMLKTFPVISLTSPIFLVSCVLVLSDHFMWFNYFTRHYHPFNEISTFFGLYVWLVPFMYFISLSANENVLPNIDPSRTASPVLNGRSTSGQDIRSNLPPINTSGKKFKPKNMFKSVIDFVTKRNEDVLPRSASAVYSAHKAW